MAQGLFHWRRLDGDWHLNSSVGAGDSIRDALRATHQTANALRVVPRLAKSEEVCHLPLELASVHIRARAEVSVMADGGYRARYVAENGGDGTGCKGGRDPFGSLDFAVPREHEPRPVKDGPVKRTGRGSHPTAASAATTVDPLPRMMSRLG
jgi:hypothetical protein